MSWSLISLMILSCLEVLYNQERENISIIEEKNILENSELSCICSSLCELRVSAERAQALGSIWPGSPHSAPLTSFRPWAVSSSLLLWVLLPLYWLLSDYMPSSVLGNIRYSNVNLLILIMPQKTSLPLFLPLSPIILEGGMFYTSYFHLWHPTYQEWYY